MCCQVTLSQVSCLSEPALSMFVLQTDGCCLLTPVLTCSAQVSAAAAGMLCRAPPAKLSALQSLCCLSLICNKKVRTVSHSFLIPFVRKERGAHVFLSQSMRGPWCTRWLRCLSGVGGSQWRSPRLCWNGSRRPSPSRPPPLLSATHTCRPCWGLSKVS